MIQNKFGQVVLKETDVCDLLMQGRDINSLENLTLESQFDLEQLISTVPDAISIRGWKPAQDDSLTEQEFHAQQQAHWHMPESYRTMDIAAHVLNLCESQAELQRCGTELLLFQERNLFDLLRYLTYLVNVMRENNVVWGVGRGSSVASYVLYKLGVHKIDSLYYDLDPKEFLR